MSTGHEPTVAAADLTLVTPVAGDAYTLDPESVYRLSIRQYNTMVEAGCFETDDLVRPRLELLEGVLIKMSPIKPPHILIVDALNYWAMDNLDRKVFRVSIQSPLEVHPTSSEPEPDVLVYRAGHKGLRHPSEREAALVIEVAESSLRHDLIQKASIYARGGVPEYWVVDIPGRRVHVYRSPDKGVYTSVKVLAGDEQFSPEVAPGAMIVPQELFAVLGDD